MVNQESIHHTEEERLSALWQDMVLDLKLICGQDIPDPERDELVAEYNKNKTANPVTGEPYIYNSMHRFRFHDFLKLSLNQLRSYETKYDFLYPPVFDLNIHTNTPISRCLTTPKEESTGLDLDIAVTHTTKQVAQEELLHGAYDVLYRLDTFKTSELNFSLEQLAHTSVVLDMAMSFVAQQEGTWDYWHTLALDFQKKHRDQFVVSRHWPKTLLGKTLNRRFQYRDISLASIGRSWNNLTKYYDAMFGTQAGITHDTQEEIYDLLCLTHGVHHKELSNLLVDLPIEVSQLKTHDDYVQAGNIIVDWAKRAMEWAQQDGFEEELVSHHSPLRSLPDTDYFAYQLPMGVRERLERAINDDTNPVLHLFNGNLIIDVHNENWSLVVEEIYDAYVNKYFRKDSDKFSQLLKQYGISKKMFESAQAYAQAQFVKQNRLSWFD